MRLSTKLTGIVAIGGVAALGAGLISSGGIGAAFTDQATATAKIDTGTLKCELSSTDTAHVVISPNKRSATITLDTIMQSAPGSQSAPVTVTNVGSIPLATQWSAGTPSGGLFDSNASGAMQAEAAPAGATLNVGASQTVNVGFNWTELQPNDEGKSGSVTYTVDCVELANLPLTFSGSSAASGTWTPNGNVILDTPTGSSIGIELTDPYTNDAPLPMNEPSFKETDVQNISGFQDYPVLNIYISNGTDTDAIIKAYPEQYATASGNTGWSSLHLDNPGSYDFTSWATLRADLDAAGFTVNRVSIKATGANTSSVKITSFCYGSLHIGSEACGW